MCAARELEGASCGNAAKRLRTAAAERLPLAATERLAPGQVKQLMGLRRQVGGTLEYHSRAQGLPSGPTSLSELASWPRLMVRDFVEPRRKCPDKSSGQSVGTRLGRAHGLQWQDDT